ncbi:hypothetical protein BGZ98_005897 [Dissophora globulifera]|nr:hypothetical protein BGZ98_005897 [Dissophora globulifera]
MAATWAQEHGAVGVLVRSIGPLSLQSPHTGNSYAAKIPAASVSVEDVQLLSRSFKRHRENSEKFPEWPKVKLTMNAKTELSSRVSRNIIIELKGRETPEEVVVTLRQLSKLERPPRRTVRAVFWTSEENGSPGGRVYAANHPETNTTRHVFAFESDSGVFDPYGIQFTAGKRAKDDPLANSFEFLTAAGKHFMGRRKDLSYRGAGSHVLPNGGGADIAPLCKQGVACAQFAPADPFPLPYSTSPYYVKESPANEGDDEDEDEDDLMGEDRHRRHGHRHYRHGHGHGQRHGHGHHHKHHHHHDENDVAAVKNSAAVMAIWTYIAAESRVEF